MALRARELYYFVRVGNFATRPLRALQADFHKLGAAGDQAANRLQRLEMQQRKLASQRARLVTQVMSPTRDLRSAQAMQAAMSKRVSLESRLRNFKLDESKINTALYRNETTRLDLVHRRTQAEALNNKLLKEEAGTQRQLNAAHRAMVLGRQVTGAEMAGADIAGRSRLLASAAVDVRNQIKGVELQLKQLAAAEGDAEAETARLISRLHALGMELEYLQKQELETAAIMRQQKWDKIALRGRALSDFGRTAQYAGALTTIAFGLMAKSAAEFNKEVTLAATQVGNNMQEIQQSTEIAQAGILRQMQRFPASADEMAKASYDIFSSLTLQGNAAEQTAQGLQILEVANRAAVAGQADLASVTNAMIVILNQFARAGKGAAVDLSQLETFMARTFAAVRYGRTTFEEFTGVLAQAAPAAKSAGQSFDQMAGTLAFLTRQMPVRQAAVSYARLIEVIQRSEVGLRKHGVRVRDEAGNFRPLNQILKDMAERFPQVTKGRRAIMLMLKEVTKGTGTGTVGTAQARRGLVPLLMQQKQYQKVLSQTMNKQDQFWQQFKALRETPEVKWRIFINQLHVIAMELGQEAIPAFMKIIDQFQRAAKWFDNLSDGTKRNIAVFGTWGGVIALVGGTFAILVGTTMRVVAQFKVFERFIFGNKTALRALAGEAGSVSAIFARRLGIGIAILAMIKFHDQTRQVINLLGGLPSVLTTISLLLGAKMVMSFAQMGLAAGLARGKVGMLLTSLAELRTIGPIVIEIEIIRHFIDPDKKRSGKNPFKDIAPLDFLVGNVNDLMQTPGPRGSIAPVGTRMNDLYQMGLNGTSMPRGLNRAERAAYNAGKRASRRQQVRSGAALGAAMGRGPQIQERVARVRARMQILNNRSVQEWIKLSIRANREAAKHPKNLEAQIRAARIMNEIQKRFKGAELEGIQAVISADSKATKKRISNAKKLAEEQKRRMEEAVSNMSQMYDQMLEANRSAMGSLTEGVLIGNQMEFGNIPFARDILGDLRSQITRFETWRKELGQLGKRLPAGLVKELQEAGIDAEPILKGLLKMTPRQVQTYIGLWRRRERDIRNATAGDFNKQLSMWRSHGQKAAVQFMRGMRDEGSFINKQMKSIFLSWLKGKPQDLKPDRPSAQENRPGRTRRNRRGNENASRHLTVHNHDTLHVHNNKEDLSTTLRKARLNQKSRRAARLGWYRV